MCNVYIATPCGTVKANPADLEPKVRLAWAVELMESWHKPKAAAKMQSKPVATAVVEPAPLQCGGTVEKALEPYWGREDSMGHYRQRCGEHNHREQVFHKTSRRRQVVRY